MEVGGGPTANFFLSHGSVGRAYSQTFYHVEVGGGGAPHSLLVDWMVAWLCSGYGLGMVWLWSGMVWLWSGYVLVWSGYGLVMVWWSQVWSGYGLVMVWLWSGLWSGYGLSAFYRVCQPNLEQRHRKQEMSSETGKSK